MDDLSTLMGQLGGSGQDPTAALGGLTQAVQAEGGLDGLVSKLRAGGLGDAVDSWVSTGANQQINSVEVLQLLGSRNLSDMARCRVPDDCIDPRRLPLFAGRAFFRDLIITIETRQSGESQL